jgi:hypothetical protein
MEGDDLLYGTGECGCDCIDGRVVGRVGISIVRFCVTGKVKEGGKCFGT